MDKIAVIGGSYLQLPIVKKAKEMGIEVHCFSWPHGAVCAKIADYFYPISIIEKEDILKKCQQIGINAIVTIASDTAVVTVNYVANKMGLVANPIEYTGITTNKYLMRQAFIDNNIPSPKFVKVMKGDNPCLSNIRLPFIVKPTDRSGSRGVQKIESLYELSSALKKAQNESFGAEAIIEEFIDGNEVSVESISFHGKHYILQITDKVTTGAPYFVELEHHQPTTIKPTTQNRVRDIVHAALDALHIVNGASHSELKITPDGKIKVIEIGARMGGDFIGSDLVELSTGYDFLKGVIQVALNKFECPIIENKAYSGVYFLSEDTKHILPIFNEWTKHKEIVKCEITNPTLQHIHQSADRSGYIIYQSDHKYNIQ